MRQIETKEDAQEHCNVFVDMRHYLNIQQIIRKNNKINEINHYLLGTSFRYVLAFENVEVEAWTEG